MMCWPWEHKWKIIKEVAVYEGDISKRPVSRNYLLKCKICGDLKSKKVSY